MKALQDIPLAILMPAVNILVAAVAGWLGDIEAIWHILLIAVLGIGGVVEGVALARAVGAGTMGTLGDLMAGKKP